MKVQVRVLTARRWRLPLEALGSEQYKAVQEQLRAQGVVVEAQALPSSRAAPRLVVQEEAAPSLLLEQYAALAGMGQGPLALAQQAVQAVAESGARGESSRRHTLLTLAGVTIEGYGPFRQPQTYTLADKGLRALTGRNEDDGGASSNGAGKSSLVSAPL
ncbi:metallophos domain-containing protein, partial [Haematococcus lacustris]